MLPSVTAHISVVRWRQQCLVIPSVDLAATAWKSGTEFHHGCVRVDLAEIAWNNDNKIPSRMHAHRFSWFVIAAEYRSARRSKTLIWTSASLISNPCVLIVRVWSPQAFSSWLCLYQTLNHMRSLYDSFDTQNWHTRYLKLDETYAPHQEGPFHSVFSHRNSKLSNVKADSGL